MLRSWSIPIGKIFGADLRIHILFLVLLGWVVVTQLDGGASPGRALALAAVLLGSMLLHETAEMAVAAAVDVPPRLVLLLATGGIHFGFGMEAESVPGSRRSRGE